MLEAQLPAGWLNVSQANTTAQTRAHRARSGDSPSGAGLVTGGTPGRRVPFPSLTPYGEAPGAGANSANGAMAGLGQCWAPHFCSCSELCSPKAAAPRLRAPGCTEAGAAPRGQEPPEVRSWPPGICAAQTEVRGPVRTARVHQAGFQTEHLLAPSECCLG